MRRADAIDGDELEALRVRVIAALAQVAVMREALASLNDLSEELHALIRDIEAAKVAGAAS